MDADYLRDCRRPRPALPPRRRRDRLDRRVLLLHPPRPRPGAAEGAEGGRRRRVLGRPRRRLLPLAEVQGGAAAAARAPALVQVGGLYDVALRLRAARRPLLDGSGRATRRPRRGRPHAAGRRRRSRAAGSCSPGSSTTSPAGFSATTARWPRSRSRSSSAAAFAAGELFAARAAYLQVGRDARHDHGRERLLHDHSGALGARPREGGVPRARPAPGLRAKQRSVHNNYLTLPVVFTMLAGHFAVRLRERPRVARPAGALRARRRDQALLQPLALRDGARGGFRRRSGRGRSRSRSCWRRRTRPRRATGQDAERRRS